MSLLGSNITAILPRTTQRIRAGNENCQKMQDGVECNADTRIEAAIEEWIDNGGDRYEYHNIDEQKIWKET